MPVRIKPCSGPCGQSYPITHFWSDAGAPDGRMSRCPTCEKNARRSNAEARASGQIEPAEDGRRGHYSDEERERRRELAKRLHAEGRFGGAVIGARGGAAVKRHRISDAVLEHFRQPEKQQLVVSAYEKALKGKNKQLAKATADSLMRLDMQVAERERADRGGAVDPHSLTDEELMEFVAQGLQGMIERGEIPVDVDLPADQVQEIA